MLNIYNWFTRLNAFICPSVTMNANGQWSGDPYGNNNNSTTASQIAKELQLLNAVNRPVYTPNQFTSNQLSQFNQPIQSNPYYQQYLNKMGGMGAGAGKTAPSTPTQGTK